MTVTAPMCPNCGAPLEVVDGRCRFCEVPLAVSPTARSGPRPMAPPPHLRAAGAADAPDAPFRLTVDDTFFIRKRGLVVTGRVASGTVRVGDALRIDGPSGSRDARCVGIEMFRKTVDAATAGDDVGLRLDGVDDGGVAAGDTITHA